MSDIEKIKAEIERRKKENMYDDLPMTIGRYYEDRDLLSFIDSLPEEKLSEDLEEAAEEYSNKNEYMDVGFCVEPIYIGHKTEGAFIAGAEWMRKKDVEDMYMSDNRHFLKCYEQGKVDMKVEMMKDAVEAKIYGYDDGSFELIASWLDMPNNSIYKDGDKVKIIIVKQ